MSVRATASVRCTLGVAIVIAASIGPRASFAEGRAEKGALAEALFREGRRLMAEGRIAAGCAKLAESQRLDPNLATLLNLATCHALDARTATAWTEFTQAIAKAHAAGNAAQEAFAREHAREVEAQLSRVVIVAPRPVPGLTVTLDGEKLGDAALGTGLPVDPGKHAVGASAPSRASWSTSVEVPRGPSTQTIHLPELPPAPADRPVPAPLPPRPSTGRISPLAWAFGALSLVGIGVGTYFGVTAFSKNSAAAALCPNDRCTPAGLDVDRQARTAATASTVVFPIAVAAAGASIAFFVISRPASTSPPVVALSPLGGSFGGRW